MFLDSVINRKLKRNCLDYSCLVGFGDRGVGKSSVMALISSVANADGRDVYCQYPYKDTYKIPTKMRKENGISILDVDKDWLYSHKFKPYSVIMLDEGSTIWPARNFKKWNERDTMFFNFIRKEHILIVIFTQYYDQLDLNVKRAADETWFLEQSLWFPNLTRIEASITKNVKIADKNTEVLGTAFKRGARKVSFDVCEIPKHNYRFYRKPYYNDFDTDYVPFMKVELPVPLWNDVYPQLNST